MLPTFYYIFILVSKVLSYSPPVWMDIVFPSTKM